MDQGDKTQEYKPEIAVINELAAASYINVQKIGFKLVQILGHIAMQSLLSTATEAASVAQFLYGQGKRIIHYAYIRCRVSSSVMGDTG